MISTDAFNYINVLDKAADVSWTRETLITNNLANVNTPNYKRKDIDFQSALRNELGRFQYTSLDEKIAKDISILNISNVSSFADYFVICSAQSNTQVKALTENLADKIKQTFAR